MTLVPITLPRCALIADLAVNAVPVESNKMFEGSTGYVLKRLAEPFVATMPVEPAAAVVKDTPNK